MLSQLLDNQFVQGILVAGVGWLVNKIAGARKDSTTAKAAAALATSVSLMAQFALTEPNQTPTSLLTAFKGIVAIQFAKVGITEAHRKPFQPMIDAAISRAVTEWVKLHPEPQLLTMPITNRLDASTR